MPDQTTHSIAVLVPSFPPLLSVGGLIAAASRKRAIRLERSRVLQKKMVGHGAWLRQVTLHGLLPWIGDFIPA